MWFGKNAQVDLIRPMDMQIPRADGAALFQDEFQSIHS